MFKQKVTSETKPCEEYLSCLLTDKELIAKSRELAKANEDLADVEAKKKDVMADFTAQQKKHEANISVLSRIVSGGKEYRNVKCEWTFDYISGIKTLMRLDTHDIIKREEITQKERQVAFVVVEKEAAEQPQQVQ